MIPPEDIDKVISKFSFDKPLAGTLWFFGLFVLKPFVTCFDKAVAYPEP